MREKTVNDEEDIILRKASVVIMTSASTSILNFVTQYSIYSGSITFALSVIGNAINILVFTQLKLFRGNQSVFYLTVESISSLVYQFISVSETILTSLYGDDTSGRSRVWCKLKYILSQITVLTTFTMICFAAADQFFSTNYRLNMRQTCTLKLSRCLACTFICIWIIHSIAFGSFFDVQSSVGCVISNPICLEYATYFFYPVLVGLLPIVVASVFSLLAFRNVRRIVRRQLPIVRRRLDRQMTAMVLMLVIFFVCLALPYAIYRMYAINVPVSSSKPMEYAVGRLLQTVFAFLVALNHTISFYVFMMSSSRFRRQVKLVLVKKFWKQWKHWCFENNQISPEIGETVNSNLELEENI